MDFSSYYNRVHILGVSVLGSVSRDAHDLARNSKEFPVHSIIGFVHHVETIPCPLWGRKVCGVGVGLGALPRNSMGRW